MLERGSRVLNPATIPASHFLQQTRDRRLDKLPRARNAEATARSDERVVDVADIRQVGREDDLAAERANDTVGDRKKTMHVEVAVGARG